MARKRSTAGDEVQFKWSSKAMRSTASSSGVVVPVETKLKEPC